MKAFPLIRDLVTDVSWNFEVKKKIRKFKPRPPDAEDGSWRIAPEDTDRVQEFGNVSNASYARMSAMCCGNTNCTRHSSARAIWCTRRPWKCADLDVEDRLHDLKNKDGISLCNITKCCTNVCPEDITITDNAIIPLKERVVDRFYG